MTERWIPNVEYKVRCFVCHEEFAIMGKSLNGVQAEFEGIPDFRASERMVCNKH